MVWLCFFFSSFIISRWTSSSFQDIFSIIARRFLFCVVRCIRRSPWISFLLSMSKVPYPGAQARCTWSIRVCLYLCVRFWCRFTFDQAPFFFSKLTSASCYKSLLQAPGRERFIWVPWVFRKPSVFSLFVVLAFSFKKKIITPASCHFCSLIFFHLFVRCLQSSFFFLSQRVLPLFRV